VATQPPPKRAEKPDLADTAFRHPTRIPDCRVLFAHLAPDAAMMPAGELRFDGPAATRPEFDWTPPLPEPEPMTRARMPVLTADLSFLPARTVPAAEPSWRSRSFFKTRSRETAQPERTAYRVWVPGAPAARPAPALHAAIGVIPWHPVSLMPRLQPPSENFESELHLAVPSRGRHGTKDSAAIQVWFRSQAMPARAAEGGDPVTPTDSRNALLRWLKPEAD
jgi:hypothetical protein